MIAANQAIPLHTFIPFGQDKPQILDPLVLPQEFALTLPDILLHQLNSLEIFPVISLFLLKLGGQLDNQLFGLGIHTFFKLCLQL